ncbi:hypothetical protein AgCh_028059 [Apium graveolens]
MSKKKVKGITKIGYRKFRRVKKFFKKGGSTNKKGFRKSEGKCAKYDRGDNSKVKCYNCGERGHISPDYKKGKSDKGKALVTKKKSWVDSSDSEDEVNYTLMANADGSPETAELKVPQTTYAFHTDDITELRLYLKTMFISYRDQTLTCERLTSENLAFKKRNDYLEKELVMFHQTQKERDDAFYVRDELLKLNKSLKTELEKEKEIIRTWTNSSRTTQNLLSSGNWKEALGYGDDKSEKGTEQIEPIVVKQTFKPKVNPVKFVAKTVKSDSKKMKESVTKVKEKSTSDKLEQDKPAEVNIGLMTKKKLKHKLKEIRNVNKVKAARKNRNGKEGVNKRNNYMPVPNGPRKKCYNCGNSNHLASFCRKNKNINSLPPKLGVKSQSVRLYGESWPRSFLWRWQHGKNSGIWQFLSKTESSILEPYHLLHFDLFGPVNVMSIAKKKYVMVIVDEFTSDNDTEFKNSIMEEFCKEHGIKHEFYAPGTPQQNGVVERKNRTLIEAARTMLDEAKLATYFWAEALSKFDLKADEGIFVEYPLSTKAFRVYNLRTRVFMKSINVSFDDKKITGLEDFNDHDQLRFENEDLNFDSVNSDELNSEPVSTDVIESIVTTPKENALVQGEQAEDPTTSQDSQEASEPVTGSSSADSSSSDDPNSDNSGSSNTSNPEGS